MSGKMNDRGRVQSVEQGIQLLKTLASNGEFMSLKDIAAAVNMPPSKAHRYLASLTATEMVEQHTQNGLYRLGHGSLNIGLAALAGLDLVQQAESIMGTLCSELDETVLLSVWGNNGPTIIKMLEPPRPVTVNVRVGFNLPLLSSATGHVFCAYAPAQQISSQVKKELRLLNASNRRDMPGSRQELKILTRQVQAKGLSRVKGALLAGVNSMSGPVFNHESQLAAVLTVLGAADEINISWTGSVARQLKEACKQISYRLGHNST